MRYLFLTLFAFALGAAFATGMNELQHVCTNNHVIGDWLK